MTATPTTTVFPRPASSRFARATATALALLLVNLLVGCRRSGGEPVATRAGGLTLNLALNPEAPRLEDNTLELEVRDGNGQPVQDAQLEVVASMPSMAWIPGMRSKAGITANGEGRYRAEFDLVMSGTWALDVRVKSPAGAANSSYTFTVGSKGLQATGAAVPAAASSPTMKSGAGAWSQPPEAFPTAALVELQAAIAAAEEVRNLLAQDRIAGLSLPAQRLASALGAARSAFPNAATDVGNCLAQVATAAAQLGAAADLQAARASFGEVNRFLVALATVDPRLRMGWFLFECPMTETFPLWMQRSPTVENPYLGTAMSTCGKERQWASVEENAAENAQAGGISHYTCSMHPAVHEDGPGTCPICSMNLVAVTNQEVASGEIIVPEGRRQRIGVRTGRVERQRMVREIRAVGKVTYDETGLAEVSVKYSGWIDRLDVNTTGQSVRKGQTLFTLYSPELYAAQVEFLTFLRSQQAARQTAAPERSDYLVQAARQRLRLWDLTDSQIDQLAKNGIAIRHQPIVSPVTGTVLEKMVVAGAAVEPGMTLFRIAALDRVWVEADVAESELPLIAVGQEALVTLPYLPGQGVAGKVAFILPYLDAAARTGRVRIELPNRDRLLKPDMYAEVSFQVDSGERLVVPESAVLYAGPRRLVFLDLGEGRLKPQEIQIGAKTGEFLEVLSGLKAGDLVVTSGTFLVAAESRLKSATEQWQ